MCIQGGRLILKYLGKGDWCMVAVLAVLVVFQVFLDLRIPEYMSDITDSIQMGLPTDVIADAGIGMVDTSPGRSLGRTAANVIPLSRPWGILSYHAT